MNTKTAKSGDWTISVAENGSIKITKAAAGTILEIENTMDAIRKIANETGFTLLKKWNTRMAGKHLINHINKMQEESEKSVEIIDIVIPDDPVEIVDEKPKKPKKK